jgi:hypothetical protein
MPLSSLHSPVPLPLLSLIVIYFLCSSPRNQMFSSTSSLASFGLYFSSSLLLVILTQSWASPLLLSRSIISLSIVGLLLSSFAMSFPLLYAHLSVLSTLLSPSVESAAVLVFSLNLLFLLTSFSTDLLLRRHDSKHPQWSSSDSGLSLSVLVLWILQCLSFGRLFFFLSGHRYDFSTLQVPPSLRTSSPQPPSCQWDSQVSRLSRFPMPPPWLPTIPSVMISYRSSPFSFS